MLHVVDWLSRSCPVCVSPPDVISSTTIHSAAFFVSVATQASQASAAFLEQRFFFSHVPLLSAFPWDSREIPVGWLALVLVALVSGASRPSSGKATRSDLVPQTLLRLKHRQSHVPPALLSPRTTRSLHRPGPPSQRLGLGLGLGLGLQRPVCDVVYHAPLYPFLARSWSSKAGL